MVEKRNFQLASREQLVVVLKRWEDGSIPLKSPEDTCCYDSAYSSDSADEVELKHFFTTPIYDLENILCTTGPLKTERDLSSQIKVERQVLISPEPGSISSELFDIANANLELSHLYGESIHVPETKDAGTQTESPVKTYKYCCKICKSEFNNLEFFNHHELMHLPKMNGCSYCNATFSSKTEVRRHIFQHLNENYFSCVYCQAAFSKKSALKEHIRLHTSNNLKKCDCCSAVFNRMVELETHKRRCKRETSDSLVHVFRTIQQNYDMSGKKNIVRTKKCPKCKRLSISGQKKLQDHEKIHKRLIGKYSCEVCQAKFLNKSSWTRHRQYAH